MNKNKIICSIKFEEEVVCQICNYTHPTTIQNHIRFKHPEISIRDYMIKYDAEITSEKLKVKRAEKSAIKKGPMSNEQKLLRSIKNKKFWEDADIMKEKVSNRMKEAAINGTHPSQTPEYRDMARKSAIERNKTDKQKNAVKKALTGITLPPERVEKSAAGHRGIPLKESTKWKLSEVHRKAFASGKRNLNGRYIGSIWSEKNKKVIYYRSKLELLYINKLENDINVTVYRTEFPRIKYEIDGKFHTYLPDFFINEKDVVEVNAKVIFYLNKNKKEAKAKAARQYCLENGLTYKILYEEDLGVIVNLPSYMKKYNFPNG